MSPPSVTVVIPVYNPGSHLRAAITSVLAQTCQPREVIVIDDGGSEDVTWIEREYPQIRCLRQKNQGSSVARNAGILEARGEYVAFIDQDDLWEPAKLEKQLAVFASDAQVGLCHTAFDLVDGAGHRLGPGFGADVRSYEELLLGSRVMMCTVVVRRAVFAAAGLFDHRYRGVQDYDMWLRVLRHTKPSFVPTVEACWRTHSSNCSNDWRLMYAEVEHLLARHIREAKRLGNRLALANARAGRAKVRQSYACTALERARTSRGRGGDFWSDYWFALRRQPGLVVRSTAQFAMNRMMRRQSSAGAEVDLP